MSATLADVSVAHGRVTVPPWGRTWADVSLASTLDVAVGSRQTLVVGDVPIAMSVVSGGTHEGKSAYRLVSGIGWSQTIAYAGYKNDAGVKLASVLRDAASACGETVADAPTSTLGPHFARQRDIGAAVLNTIVPRGWYVDFAGVTRIGQRPTTAYSGDAPRTRVDKDSGIIELATETVAGLVPGVVVDGSAPATDVEYVLEPRRLTARLWTGPARGSRRLDAFAKLVAAVTAQQRYWRPYEYRVVTQEGERLNLQIVRTSTGMGDLQRVPVRPGVAGCRSNVTLGELVLVVFADGDPSRPNVIAHDAADAPGWMPLTIELGGPGALGVARVTDTVQAGPWAGAITSSSARVKASL